MEKSNVRFVTKAIAMLLMIVLAVGMLSVSQVSAASKLKLNAAKANLTVGQSKQLKVKNTKKKVTWSSNKKSVATVSKTGKVKAKKAGKTTITAKVGKTRLKCVITVKNKAAKKKVLVAYFSATGSTKRVAGFIKSAANADTYRIKPQKPYTEDDLDWTVNSSRVNQEHNAGSEPAISGKISNLNQYDVIYLGYPIWWGEAPNIMHTFLKSHDLSGKTVIPFCTSMSSGLGSSAKNLHKFAPKANWQKGKRFDSDASKKSVQNWVKGLKY